jgi:DNA-binding MarR family transcriptional regulator
MARDAASKKLQELGAASTEQQTLIAELHSARDTASEESKLFVTVTTEQRSALERDKKALASENAVLEEKKESLEAALAQLTADRDQFKQVRGVALECVMFDTVCIAL